MASSSQTNPTSKVVWDECNTGILLTLLVDQIDAGNRPAGHFFKTAWSNITTKFKELTSCNFSTSQLKNKWDNMKKDFGLWEKLLHEETGLGYDHITSRIVADPHWWRTKLQEKPEYRKFRTHGPLHLELQERVFRGVVATSYMEYYLEDDTFLGENFRNEEVPTDIEGVPRVDPMANNEEVVEEEPAIPEQVSDAATRPVPVPKRKRSRSTTTKTTVGDVNDGMLDMINSFREESQSSIRQMEGNSNEYQKCLQRVVELPWLDVRSAEFAALVIMLEDPTKRTAFEVLSGFGEEVIKNWIAAGKPRN